MSESSDTTHEAIRHNVVTHQLRLTRQVTQIQSDVNSLQTQLHQIHRQLQTLLAFHGVHPAPEAQPTNASTERDRQCGGPTA